jgi:hypothetical protein
MQVIEGAAQGEEPFGQGVPAGACGERIALATLFGNSRSRAFFR